MLFMYIYVMYIYMYMYIHDIVHVFTCQILQLHMYMYVDHVHSFAICLGRSYTLSAHTTNWVQKWMTYPVLTHCHTSLALLKFQCP